MIHLHSHTLVVLMNVLDLFFFTGIRCSHDKLQRKYIICINIIISICHSFLNLNIIPFPISGLHVLWKDSYTAFIKIEGSSKEPVENKIREMCVGLTASLQLFASIFIWLEHCFHWYKFKDAVRTHVPVEYLDSWDTISQVNINSASNKQTAHELWKNEALSSQLNRQ